MLCVSYVVHWYGLNQTVLHFRGMKDMESDISSIEKRFAYGFLQKLLKWMEIAQEFIAHLGTVAQTLRKDPVTCHRKTFEGIC